MLSLGARLARQHGASRLARRLTSRAGPKDAALARAPPVNEIAEMRDAPEFFAMYKTIGGDAEEALYRQRLQSFFLYTLNAQLGYSPEICRLPPTATQDEKGYRFYASRYEAMQAYKEAENIGGEEFSLIFDSVDNVHAYT